MRRMEENRRRRMAEQEEDEETDEEEEVLEGGEIDVQDLAVNFDAQDLALADNEVNDEVANLQQVEWDDDDDDEMEIDEDVDENQLEILNNEDYNKRNKHGVLVKLVHSLKHECPTSAVRFWITRALEAFLRGEIITLNQIFLLKHNLVEDTLNLLISGCLITSNMVTQGCLDFLSTLTKFNVEAFERCNKTLDCSHKINTLMNLAQQNLVDSNMFIRVVILTSEHVKQIKPKKNDLIHKCRLMRKLSQPQVQYQLAIDLINLLTVCTISQENVSCLNTSLLILILSHRHEDLNTFFLKVRQLKDNVKMLEKMKLLFTFWYDHYTLPIKKQDCKSLENSTNIKFTEWISVVKVLLKDDVTDTCSIRHHHHVITNPTILHSSSRINLQKVKRHS